MISYVRAPLFAGVMLVVASGTALSATTVLWDVQRPYEMTRFIAADVVGDSRHEIVLGWFENVEILDGTGSSIGLYPLPAGLGSVRDLAVGDITGDGTPEILVTTALCIRAIDVASGSLLAGPLWGCLNHDSKTLRICDLNGDGADDIIGFNSFKVLVYDVAAGTRTDLILPFPPNITVFTWGGAAVGDIDFDGTPEIVVTTDVETTNSGGAQDHSEVYVIDGATLSVKPGFPILIGTGKHLRDPLLVDLDRDYQSEIVGGGLGAINALGADGSLIAPALPISSLYSGFRIAPIQLDSDPEFELVVADHERVNVVEFATPQQAGSILAQTPPGPYRAFKSPVVGDLDGDGLPEVGVLSVTTTTNGQDPHYHVLESDLTPASGWPKRLADLAPGASLTSYLRQTVMTDLDGDGAVDFLAAFANRIVAWSLYDGPPVPLMRAEWPQSQGDERNSGQHWPLSAFVRGDASNDGAVNLLDGIVLLSHLFQGASLSCLAAGDADDSGALNLLDPILILNYLFGVTGVSAPAAPYPACGGAAYQVGLACAQHSCP